jgi:hypothetical protein
VAKRILIGSLIVFAIVVVLFAAFLYQAKHSEGVAFLNQVRYKQGEHKGAAFCRECHPVIYEQWKNKSRHAVALSAESVQAVIHNLKEHTILNYMLGGEEMCYACHGPKAANEGINCETCHGPAMPDTDIMISHEKVFKPNKAALQQDDFCAHVRWPTVTTPVSSIISEKDMLHRKCAQYNDNFYPIRIGK